MNKIKITIQLSINKATKSLSSKLWLVTALLFLTTTSVAATNNNTAHDHNTTSTAYVDSVFQWGAWELDIEPAAGGLQPQTTQALNARDSKVRLRTNSMSVLAPPQRAQTRTRAPAPLPMTPSAPPVTPPIPPGKGGPSDGLF